LGAQREDIGRRAVLWDFLGCFFLNSDFFRLRYAKVAINVSAPIVPFRETIIPPPQVDAVKEAITETVKVSFLR